MVAPNVPRLLLLSEDLNVLRKGNITLESQLETSLKNREDGQLGPDVCIEIMDGNNIPEDVDNAVVVHIRPIRFWRGTEIIHSRLCKYPVHLLQV